MSSNKQYADEWYDNGNETSTSLSYLCQGYGNDRVLKTSDAVIDMLPVKLPC